MTPPPHPSALAGSWAKIDRARKHRRDLDDAVAVWLETKPYSLRTDLGPEIGQRIIRLDHAPAVPPALNAIIGDAIHNLRAALDHLVYRLAVLESGQDPPPRHDRLAFPIASSEDQFERKSANHRGTLSDAIWGSIEAFQPFRTHPEAPKHSALWFLEELDIVDKHREFTLTLTVLGPELRLAATGPGISIHGLTAPRLLEDNTPLVSYETEDPDVRLHIDPAFSLAFADRHIFPEGHAVSDVLDTLIANTETVVGAWQIERIEP